MSIIVTIQDRELAQADIDTIRQMIADNPNWHRTRLFKELCMLCQWRTLTALLKDMACRSMLRKLEQKGLVTLPIAHHSGNRQQHIVDLSYDQAPIHSDLCAIRLVQLVPVKGRSAADDLFHCLIARYHYLGCKGHVGEHMKYLAFDRKQRPVAGLLFGSAAWKTTPRDRIIGWDQKIRRKNLNFMTSNTRFLSCYGSGSLILPALSWGKASEHIVYPKRRKQAFFKFNNYFTRNRCRMQYVDFCDIKIPIGSGCVESATRRVVNLRIKSPGIFWKPETSESMLFLRSQLLSREWNIMLSNIFIQFRSLCLCNELGMHPVDLILYFLFVFLFFHYR